MKIKFMAISLRKQLEADSKLQKTVAYTLNAHEELTDEDMNKMIYE